jgi:hypothetical protein
MLEVLVELRDDKAELDKKLKGVNGEIDAIEAEIIGDMVASNDQL